MRPKRPGSDCPFAAVVSVRGEHDLATNAQLVATLACVFGSVLVDLGYAGAMLASELLARIDELERRLRRSRPPPRRGQGMHEDHR